MIHLNARYEYLYLIIEFEINQTWINCSNLSIREHATSIPPDRNHGKGIKEIEEHEISIYAAEFI